jgi:hypothetical protein
VVEDEDEDEVPPLKRAPVPLLELDPGPLLVLDPLDGVELPLVGGGVVDCVA